MPICVGVPHVPPALRFTQVLAQPTARSVHATKPTLWLVRATEGMDMFGYGAREAVVRALRGDPVDRAPFGAPAPAGELVAAILDVLRIEATEVAAELEVPASPTDLPALAALAFAHGWRLSPTEGHADGDRPVRVRPLTT